MGIDTACNISIKFVLFMFLLFFYYPEYSIERCSIRPSLQVKSYNIHPLFGDPCTKYAVIDASNTSLLGLTSTYKTFLTLT